MSRYSIEKGTAIKVLINGLKWNDDNLIDDISDTEYSFGINDLSLYPLNFKRDVCDPKRKYEKQLWYGFKVKGKTILVHSDFVIIENQTNEVGFIALYENA